MQQKIAKAHISGYEQIIAIKANDAIALKMLYQDNFYKVEKYVLNNNGSVDQAKDIYQEAFIAVWRNIQLDKFIPENENALSGYLYKVAKNKWLDHLRSAHYKKMTAINENIAEVADDIIPEKEEKYIEDVKKQFKLLGKNCQDVLTRFYYEKESMKEIAEQYQWTEATARNNKYRCLQKLRDLIKNKNN